MSAINRRVVVAQRPSPAVTLDCFRLEEAEKPTPGEGEILIRVLWLSCDPAMRGWIAEGPNYSPPVPLGDPMRSFTVGRVEESRNPKFPEGSYVFGRQGWQDYAISDGSDIDRIIDPDLVPLQVNLHLLGMTGLTAYCGLLSVGQPKAGETIAVSTAAGAVGSVVGQIGKILGCRTVGFTGSDDKVEACLKEFGYDAAINYKTCEDYTAALDEAAPDGVDIYYDMTGGPVSDAIMERINLRARIIVVGTMAIPSAPPPMGPRVSRQLLVNRAKMEGFLVFDYFDRLEEAVKDLASWYSEGKISVREDVVEGLEKAPEQLLKLLAGENQGKALVKIAES